MEQKQKIVYHILLKILNYHGGKLNIYPAYIY